MDISSAHANRTASNPYLNEGVTEPRPADGRFADALQAATASQTALPPALLTSAELSAAHRPNIKEFMDASGAGFEDAAELIYGVIGSNTDTRDWQAIMASADPITAARRATGQMYGDPARPLRDDASYLGDADTLARSGNFALRLQKDDEGQVLDSGLKLVDARGLLLRDAGGSADAISRNAWLFGFDLADAAPLVAKAGDLSPSLQAQIREATAVAGGAATAAVPLPAAMPQQLESAGAVPASDAESAPAGEALALAQEQEDDTAANTPVQLQDLPGDVYDGNRPATSSFIDTASALQALLKVIDEAEEASD